MAKTWFIVKRTQITTINRRFRVLGENAKDACSEYNQLSDKDRLVAEIERCPLQSIPVSNLCAWPEIAHFEDAGVGGV